MMLDIIYLRLNGEDAQIEVDRRTACVYDVLETFHLSSVRRAGCNARLSTRIPLASILSKDHDQHHPLHLEGDKKSLACTNVSALGQKVDELGAQMHYLQDEIRKQGPEPSYPSLAANTLNGLPSKQDDGPSYSTVMASIAAPPCQPELRLASIRTKPPARTNKTIQAEHGGLRTAAGASATSNAEDFEDAVLDAQRLMRHLSSLPAFSKSESSPMHSIVKGGKALEGDGDGLDDLEFFRYVTTEAERFEKTLADVDAVY